MAVVDGLACRKNSWHHFGAVQYGIQTAFKNTNEILACITAATNSFGVIFFELLFTNIAVIAFQLLLGHQLHTKICWLFAALTMLARSIFACIYR